MDPLEAGSAHGDYASPSDIPWGGGNTCTLSGVCMMSVNPTADISNEYISLPNMPQLDWC